MIKLNIIQIILLIWGFDAIAGKCYFIVGDECKYPTARTKLQFIIKGIYWILPFTGLLHILYVLYTKFTKLPWNE